TVANAYVKPRVGAYVSRLEDGLRARAFPGDLYIMQSSGGVIEAVNAKAFPVRILESGPAGGVAASRWWGAIADEPDLLSFDMGGTTAKLCVISDGQPLIAHDFEVDRVYRFKKGSGLPIKMPVIELIEIGAGGGSIARVDALGLLKVGPDSAGADPGPVCYGNGGAEPTVTDANLILGYLDPAYFLGGRMALDLEGARRAVKQKIADPLGLSIEEAAWGIYQIVSETMSNAARVHALERGKDPRRFPLFAFGGAGPMHAYRLALSLGSPALLAPLGAGVMSTVGFLSAPLSFDFVRSWPSQLGQMDWAQANALLAEMEGEGQALLQASGVPATQITHRRAADMRYVGQGHEIPVPLPDGPLHADLAPQLLAEFERVYQELYERLGPPVPVEVLNWRVVSSGPQPELRLQTAINTNDDSSTDANASVSTARKGERQAYFPECNGYTNTPIYDRYRLAPGATFSGPAIVEERESTVIVGPGATCRIDEQLNLVVEMNNTPS
ncbi:MAG: hydantoinase/oxoprolinase family protein, partial [Caldilineaceae bacterium]|nr:hydantoinase/oxoprolinase family protein [Caldilineaceae bacterium]